MRFNEKIWFGFFTNKKNMQIDFLIIRIEHNFLTQFSMHSVERRDKKWWLKKIYDVYYLIVKCVIIPHTKLSLLPWIIIHYYICSTVSPCTR